VHPRAKVTIGRLQEVVHIYEKSIGTKINDLDLCLEVVRMTTSTIALHSTLYISETVRDRGLVRFHGTTNRKWPTGNQIVKWLMTSH